MVSILFTDLVGSTELLQRAGDEAAQRIFQAHHKLLSDAVAGHGGREVKWEGDSLMVAFSSAADAVRCAVAMQQATSRPIVGQRLQIRVGVNVGEPLREERDYFGTPVVVARRLCDKTEGGKILCSSLVAGLLAGRRAFKFRDLGLLDLKGIAEPIAACEVIYEREDPQILLRHTPFVGRTEEMARLARAWKEARAGHGGLVMLVGEPGIGKTRMAEEFAGSVQREGATVLRGRSYEGEWAPPYGPFAEAIEAYALAAEPKELREDLASGAGVVARLAPAIRLKLPDILDPPALNPDEEQFRLLDAVSQFFGASCERAPLLLVLDDLHWADKGTLSLFRHVARYASQRRFLLVGAYRDVELDHQHPLADALVALRRESNSERVLIKGLDDHELVQLLASVGEKDIPNDLVAAISAETNGNPFFVREVLLHLLEMGALDCKGGRWTTDRARVQEAGIPEGVRHAVGQRLSRLADNTNRLLSAASTFSGEFHLGVAGRVAGLEEPSALDAIDEALDAQVIQPGARADTFEFKHALVRQTLYDELSPPRQVRLHRQVAEAMEATFGDDIGDQVAELAFQYHRSSPMPGAERGVQYALAAADRAEAAYAVSEVAAFLRMAMELMPEDDERRPRLLGRLGLALAWALDFDEAVKAASDAGDLIAANEGNDAAADYLADAALTMYRAGSLRGEYALAEQGLRYVGDRRDRTWVTLRAIDLQRQDAEDPDYPGLPPDTPERRELSQVARLLPPSQRPTIAVYYFSREESLAEAGEDPFVLDACGEYLRSLPIWHEQAVQSEQRGQLADAMGSWAQTARIHNALGDFASAREAYRRARALGARLAGPSFQALALAAARFDRRVAVDEGWEEAATEVEFTLRQSALEYTPYLAAIRASGVLAYSKLGQGKEALHLLGMLLSPLERAAAWAAANYTAVACRAAEILWVLERRDHIEVMEGILREKVVAPDFRDFMVDGRLALAYLCALQGRHDEAADWFAKARAVLDEQGARPLRAITDFDEALMYVRRGKPGDKERAAPLLDAALHQFRELGMNGWIRRAESLLRA